MQRKYFVIVAGVMMLAGCAKDSPSLASLTVMHPLNVKVTPTTGTTDICQVFTLAVSVQDYQTYTVTPDSIQWSSSDSTTISISPGGVLHTHKYTPGVTLQATVFAERQAATATSLWVVQGDAVLIIGPDGKPIPHAPCPPGF